MDDLTLMQMIDNTENLTGKMHDKGLVHNLGTSISNYQMNVK